MATVFKHPDGTFEPLCAIWEAAARPVLLERVEAGHTSLRRCLEAVQTQILVPPTSQALRSVNLPAEYQDARRRLVSGDRGQAAAPKTAAED
jgi:molybdopterin-guanine dinucleotide biosynthesis protein A